ncbi:hypothetical protein ACIRSS_23795 [Amycolatopsis sp. NPDC101161]|uniref:hypothetical protein n=1 Tax=Amycolatopsis sp. NPDC101161 TaxID=3363940 RepID=UPI00381DA6AD
MLSLKHFLRRCLGNRTLRSVAYESMYSAASLSKAVSGTSLPTWQLTKAIVVGVSGSTRVLETAGSLWQAAALERLGLPISELQTPTASTPAELAKILRGHMLGTPVETVVARINKRGMMSTSRSTITRLLSGKTLPKRELLEEFLIALYVGRDAIDRLLEVNHFLAVESVDRFNRELA